MKSRNQTTYGKTMSQATRFIILGLLLCLAATGVFAQVEVSAISPTSLVVISGANSRECPQTTCKVVMKLPRGTNVTADATAVGQAVNKKNSLWYRVTLADGRQAFVYSGTVTAAVAPVAPAATPVPTDPTAPVAPVEPVAPVAPSAPANTGRPANCTQAREWGLTDVQAAQWSHLDRDNDGVACYGD